MSTSMSNPTLKHIYLTTMKRRGLGMRVAVGMQFNKHYPGEVTKKALRRLQWRMNKDKGEAEVWEHPALYIIAVVQERKRILSAERLKGYV